MLEKNIERYLTTEIKKKAGVSYKFVSPGNSGVPDRIVILPGGRLIFVELKTDTGRLSTLQKVQIRKLRNLGQEVVVVYGLSGVKELLILLDSESPALPYELKRKESDA